MQGESKDGTSTILEVARRAVQSEIAARGLVESSTFLLYRTAPSEELALLRHAERQTPIPDLTDWQPDPGSFRDVFETPLGQAIFKLMVQRDSLLQLKTGGFYGCVAVESLSRKLLDTFRDDVRPPHIKQFIGFMGRKIMQKPASASTAGTSRSATRSFS